jgi:hypothetical protein
MHLPALLYLKLNRIFSKFFTNPVDDREIHEQAIGEENNSLSLKILMANPHNMIFRIEFEDLCFIVVMHDSCAHVMNFNDSDNCLDIETEFGNRFEEVVNQELLQLLEYLEVTIKVFDRDFEEVTVRNFDIVSIEDKLNLKFKRGEKKVSVDKGIGKLIKELDEEKIPTIHACCCGSMVGNHISLFCNEQEKERIKEKIKSHFVVGLDGILVEQMEEFKTVDGKQNLVFKW